MLLALPKSNGLLFVMLLASATSLAPAELKTQLAVIGSGPAGLGAAIYSGRANTATLVIEGPTQGGQPTKAGVIQNWPGTPEIAGPDLVDNMRTHASKNGVQFVSASVTSVDFSKQPLTLQLSNQQTVKAQAVIIATGAKPTLSNVPGEAQYIGSGVAFCANCDGPLFKDQVVAVIGGGYGALREVGLLDKFAKKILIINEQDKFKAPKMLANYANSPKIQIYQQHQLVQITGDGHKVTGIEIRDKKSNKTQTLPVDGVFMALGQSPNSAVFKEQINLNAKGEIVVDGQTLSTNAPGVFAAGDVTDKAGHQIVLANAAGYNAAMQAENYLKKLKIIE